MKALGKSALVVTLLVTGLAGCASVPKSEAKRNVLQDDAEAALATMEANDDSLKPLVQNAYGYAVFPTIGEGGFVVGGAHGLGVVYQQGRMIGYVELNQASIGAQLGGKSFSELLLFSGPAPLESLKSGKLTFGADASAIAVTAGAGAQARFQHGVAAFVMPKGGLMANLSVSGQEITYTQAYGGSGGAH